MGILSEFLHEDHADKCVYGLPTPLSIDFTSQLPDR